MEKLPELPAPFHRFHKWTEPRGVIDTFTVDQMLAYGAVRALAARSEERERCAKLCEDEATRGLLLKDQYDPAIIKACAEALDYCADRIRGVEPKEES